MSLLPLSALNCHFQAQPNPEPGSSHKNQIRVSGRKTRLQKIRFQSHNSCPPAPNPLSRHFQNNFQQPSPASAPAPAPAPSQPQPRPPSPSPHPNQHQPQPQPSPSPSPSRSSPSSPRPPANFPKCRSKKKTLSKRFGQNFRSKRFGQNFRSKLSVKTLGSNSF